MNPPYDKNLHLKILREAIKHGDEIVNLSPIRWLQDPLAEYKRGSDWKKFGDVRERIESLEVIEGEEANKLFGIQHSDLGIYHITNNAKGFHRETDYSSIMKKIVTKANKLSFKNKLTTDRSGIFIDVLDLYGGVIGKGSGFVKPLHYERKESSTSKGDNTWHCIKFATIEEAENFYDTCNTKMYYFIFKKVRSYLRLLMEYVPFLPTYKKQWTDADLYEYFNLTPEEIKIIEEEMK
jgi:hypothetical protein